MATGSCLETVSNEVFENILCYLDAKDLNNASLVSRLIYYRVVPNLYRSWKFYGLQHSSKSLRSFLQTIIWRPDLAAHVQSLDIREWRYSPRLEHHLRVEDPDMSDDEFEKRYEEKRGRPRTPLAEDDFSYDEGKDGDYEDSDAQSYGSDQDFDDYSDSDAEKYEETDFSRLHQEQGLDVYQLIKEIQETGLSRQEIRTLWDRVFFYSDTLTAERAQILRDASINLGFDRDLLVAYHLSIYTKNEFVLIAQLLTRLSNLRTLWVVFPEPGWCRPLDFSIQTMLNDSSKDPDSRVLKSLETLYICSALHIGVKGHREYHLDLEQILPFFRLKSLRSVFTLSAHRIDDPGPFPPLNFEPWLQASDITTLAFDEAQLPPHHAIQALSIPKALEHFRWAQESFCYSGSPCYGPFHSSIGKGLQAHKGTLKHLDLDIRDRYCSAQGHRANPSGNPLRGPQDANPDRFSQ